MRRTLLLVALLGVVGVWARAGSQQSITISFDPTGVIATGITTGGQAAWFSVAIESAPFVNRIVRREEVMTDTGAGQVRLELNEAVPLRSIWVAVDLTSGTYAIATPANFALRQFSPSSNAFKADATGNLNHFTWPGHLLEIWVARPGSGVWGVEVPDGGSGDEDGPANGTITIDLQHLHPVGPSAAAPAAFAKGDVFVVINPDTMQAAVVEPAGLGH